VGVLVLLVGGALVVKRVRPNRARVRVAEALNRREPAPGDAVPAAPSGSKATAGAFRPGEFGVVVEGSGALALLADVETRASRAGFRGPTVRFLAVPAGRAVGPPSRTALHLRLTDRGVESVPVASPIPADDVEMAPESLASSLSFGTFPCAAADRGAVAAALVAVASMHPAAAPAALAGAGDGPGVRAVRMLAALGARDLPAAHAHAAAAADDPATARLARIATGAALLLDGAPAEALRDLDAAGAAPAPEPAVLRLRARALERLALFDEAAAAYDALLAADPEDPVAFAGRAAIRARGDGDAHARSVASLEGFAAAHPTAVAAWRVLGELLRHDRSDATALDRAITALRRVTALRPRDPKAWDALGGALAVRARTAGGSAPWLEAAEAYREATALDAASSTSWFNRAASLHEAALALPLGADAAAYAERWTQARAAYDAALERGPRGEGAARVWFNVGLLLEAAPPGASVAKGTATSRRAFEAALEHDPDRPGARAALLGAIVAEGDVPAAQEALARLPAHVDAAERNVLEAAVRWIAGDEDGTRAALARPGPAPEQKVDPLPPLARALLARDYRRTALALLRSEARDPARIHARARARAELRDRAGLEADLALLERLDPVLAADARARDVSIRRALGGGS
jgi:tetratricopeptide (TPR) repeat protein